MAKLTAKRKNAPPKAYGKAPQQKGNLSPAEKSRIVAKASRMLGGG